MDDKTTPTAAGRRPSARDAKRSARAAQADRSVPYITRKIPVFEVLGEEGLSLIERNADTLLEEARTVMTALRCASPTRARRRSNG